MSNSIHVSTLIALFLASSAMAQAQINAPKPTDTKIYELRIYTCNEGKLPNLLDRFRNFTVRLFEKHGMENIAYWTISEKASSDDATEAKDTLVYIIAHKSQEAATASWAAFRADPEWVAAKAKSEENGALLKRPAVSIFMNPTDFSPAMIPVNGKSDGPARLFELRKYNTGESGLPGTVTRMRDWEAELFSKNGMTPIAFWTAADNQSFIYLLAHKDREIARTNWTAFFNDFNARGGARGGGGTGRGAARGATALAGSATQSGSSGSSEIRFLVPTDFSPRK